MTATENYSNIIDNIFGSGTTTFNTKNDVYNHVIGALNNPSDYYDFKTNFIERLQRIKNIYASNPLFLKDIIVQVNEIESEKNWEGAFAELAAYDYLNQRLMNLETSIYKPIKPNVTLGKTKTFALELGGSAANLDGFIKDLSLYFDVKCFKANVTDILEGIYKELKLHFGRTDFHISAEYALDISYEDFQEKRNKLLQELKSSITPSKTTFFNSLIMPNLSYRILWIAGIQTAERTYNAFSHAENFHRLLFKYANKFVKKKPTIIVLVVFPWYNSVVTNFTNDNCKFYRALSRRVFCQYKHDKAKFKTFNSKFTGRHTIHKVSNYLSGIIFLEDNTICSKVHDDTNVKSYIYLNPNAVNPVAKSLSIEFILGLNYTDFDDFDYDNY